MGPRATAAAGAVTPCCCVEQCLQGDAYPPFCHDVKRRAAASPEHGGHFCSAPPTGSSPRLTLKGYDVRWSSHGAALWAGILYTTDDGTLKVPGGAVSWLRAKSGYGTLPKSRSASERSAPEGWTGRSNRVLESTRVTDAVEKVVFSVGIAPFGTSWLPPDSSGYFVYRLIDCSPHASDAGLGAVGGPRARSAKVLRFWTMAARWNSSRAPERPLSRMRSKPW